MAIQQNVVQEASATWRLDQGPLTPGEKSHNYID